MNAITHVFFFFMVTKRYGMELFKKKLYGAVFEMFLKLKGLD